MARDTKSVPAGHGGTLALHLNSHCFSCLVWTLVVILTMEIKCRYKCEEYLASAVCLAVELRGRLRVWR